MRFNDAPHDQDYPPPARNPPEVDAQLKRGQSPTWIMQDMLKDAMARYGQPDAKAAGRVRSGFLSEIAFLLID